MKILIFGLSGSGKSTLAKPFAEIINGVWINADQIREEYNDWDFTFEGRIRQALRMRAIAEGIEKAGKIAVLDFIAPTEGIRTIVGADFRIWMDTVKESKYNDTDEIFEAPVNGAFDYHVSEWFDDTDKELAKVVETYIKRNKL